MQDSPPPPPRSPHVHTPKIIPFAFHSNASFLFILPQNVIVSCHSGRFFYENVGKHWNLHDVRIEMVLPIHTSSCSWVLELGQKCRWESWKVSVQHSIVTKVWYPPPSPQLAAIHKQVVCVLVCITRIDSYDWFDNNKKNQRNRRNRRKKNHTQSAITAILKKSYSASVGD